ncbi:MAG: ATP-binding protein [Planctomycetota bacterium]
MSQKIGDLTTTGEIARLFAHDVKNHLASIKMNVDMLEDNLAGRGLEDEGTRTKVGRIRTSLHLITDMVQDFLRLSNPLNPVFAPIDINAVVRDLAAFIEPECSATRIRIVFDLAADLPAVETDRRILSTILLNLVVNSREAIGADGVITLTSTRSGPDGVALSVADTGGGATPEVASRLLIRSFSTKEEGTGLGLIIVRQAVAVLGGSIRFENRPHEGLSFIVDLPVRRSIPPAL